MKQQQIIRQTILGTATERGPEKSVCPSEIARILYPDDWRHHMTEVVSVAIDLHRKGKVIITQKGVTADVNHIKGPIRIKIM